MPQVQAVDIEWACKVMKDHCKEGHPLMSELLKTPREILKATGIH